MTWLKKFGINLLKIIGTVVGVAPIYQAQLPPGVASIVQAGVDKLVQIGNVVVTAEGMFAGMGTGTGAQKLSAAVPFVAQIIQQSEIAVGKKLKNETLFTEGCQDITSGMAKVLNSFE